MNRNAYEGREIESLVKKSIIDHPDVIEKIKNKFKINDDLENTSSSGIGGDKADLRLNFLSGR